MRFATKRSNSGLDGLVLGGYDVPAWLGSPGGSFNLLIEEIRCRRSMRCPDEFLLMLWQITGKGRNAVWFQPNTSVCHFNIREDVCGRKLLLQTLCRLVSIWRKRRDVNESGVTSVRPGGPPFWSHCSTRCTRAPGMLPFRIHPSPDNKANSV